MAGKDTEDESPRLLAGGNPQIPKGDGDAPVQRYIAAMPGWKSDVGREVDALIEVAVPGVAKAVRWNSPLYGVSGQGWFLGVRCLTHVVRLTFFAGASLDPMPPHAYKDPAVRSVDLEEGEPLDIARLTDWVLQAARLPGWDGR